MRNTRQLVRHDAKGPHTYIYIYVYKYNSYAFKSTLTENIGGGADGVRVAVHALDGGVRLLGDGIL